MPRAPGDQTGCEERRQHHQPEERRSHSSDRRSDVLVSPRQGVEDRGRPGQAEPGGLVPNPSGGVRGGARNLQVEPRGGERHTPGEGWPGEPARLPAGRRGGGGGGGGRRRAPAQRSEQGEGGGWDRGAAAAETAGRRLRGGAAAGAAVGATAAAEGRDRTTRAAGRAAGAVGPRGAPVRCPTPSTPRPDPVSWRSPRVRASY